MSIIRIDHVSKSFGPDPVLRDVSLHVARGDIFGIVGQSGAGKSTLLRTINLLETPDSGAVVVAGRDLTRLAKRDLRAARQNIGMIFQHYNLLQNLTVFDNVAFPLRLHDMLNPPRLRRRVLDCLELVGLAPRADDYPGRLSGGQKQRVAIARALASQPEVLLCDEPTSALDAETTRALLATLRTVNVDLGVTIVIVSHELPALAALCNRVAVLDNGAVVEVFDPADTTAPRITALGRELAFYGTEAGALFHPGVLHA
ncbi:ABC transporter ATP-binding protein [Massilia phosphatilytica]|nr:ABC transporter ATP-binding protein [Massilia phosphatilytica]